MEQSVQRPLLGWKDGPEIARTYSLMTASVVRSVHMLHIKSGSALRLADVVATEEPLQVQVNGEPFAVIMRTPGADRELAAGFLLAEQVIAGVADLGNMERNPEHRNVLDISLAPAAATRFAARSGEHRRVTTNSSCGLCGRVSIESLQRDAAPITGEWTVGSRVIRQLHSIVRLSQPAFVRTGGLHAAGIFDREGRLEVLAEDVGRHNAVDKVIGRMLLAARLPLEGAMLFVSGRVSFEIVQKAFLAGIPLVAAASAPSSLAVELACEVGITLAGFVRGETFNVYSGRQRVTIE